MNDKFTDKYTVAAAVDGKLDLSDLRMDPRCWHTRP